MKFEDVSPREPRPSHSFSAQRLLTRLSFATFLLEPPSRSCKLSLGRSRTRPLDASASWSRASSSSRIGKQTHLRRNGSRPRQTGQRDRLYALLRCGPSGVPSHSKHLHPIRVARTGTQRRPRQLKRRLNRRCRRGASVCFSRGAVI